MIVKLNGYCINYIHLHVNTMLTTMKNDRIYNTICMIKSTLSYHSKASLNTDQLYEAVKLKTTHVRSQHETEEAVASSDPVLEVH